MDGCARCGGPIPPTSPSDDFCCEGCETSWRRAHNLGDSWRAAWARINYPGARDDELLALAEVLEGAHGEA